jgi:hypothetical protein
MRLQYDLQSANKRPCSFVVAKSVKKLCLLYSAPSGKSAMLLEDSYPIKLMSPDVLMPFGDYSLFFLYIVLTSLS